MHSFTAHLTYLKQRCISYICSHASCRCVSLTYVRLSTVNAQDRWCFSSCAWTPAQRLLSALPFLELPTLRHQTILWRTHKLLTYLQIDNTLELRSGQRDYNLPARCYYSSKEEDQKGKAGKDHRRSKRWSCIEAFMLFSHAWLIRLI